MRSSCWKAASWWRCQHALRYPVGVLAYDDPFGPDGEGRLDIELAPDAVTIPAVQKSPRTLTQKFDYFCSTTLLEIRAALRLFLSRLYPGRQSRRGRGTLNKVVMKQGNC